MGSSVQELNQIGHENQSLKVSIKFRKI